MEYNFEPRITESFGQILEPVIPVRIMGPQADVELFMLIDSGADVSLIPFSIGELLGLQVDLGNRREASGVGEGAVPYILSETRLRIAEAEVPARIGWALIDEVPLILGRLDVFRQFSIEFREFENKIIVEKAPTPGP